MDSNVQAVIDAMQQQQKHFMATLKRCLIQRRDLRLGHQRRDSTLLINQKRIGRNTLRDSINILFCTMSRTLTKNERFYSLVSIRKRTTSSKSVWRVKCIGTNFRSFGEKIVKPFQAGDSCASKLIFVL